MTLRLLLISCCWAAAWWSPLAHADLLVLNSTSSGIPPQTQILRYSARTGEFLGVFATVPPYGSALLLREPGLLYYAHDDEVLRYDVSTGALVDTFARGGGVDGASSMAFAANGDLLVGSFGFARGSKVVRYSGSTGAYVGDFVGLRAGGLQTLSDLEFGPDGDLYAADRLDGTVLRYDGDTGRFEGVFASVGPTNGLQDLLFAPDGMLYALDQASQQITRFDAGTGSFVDAILLPALGTDGTGMALGSDGRLYVTTGFVGRSVIIVDPRSGRVAGTLVPPGSGGLDYATDLVFTSSIDEIQAFWLLLLGFLPVASLARRRSSLGCAGRSAFVALVAVLPILPMTAAAQPLTEGDYTLHVAPLQRFVDQQPAGLAEFNARFHAQDLDLDGSFSPNEISHFNGDGFQCDENSFCDIERLSWRPGEALVLSIRNERVTFETLVGWEVTTPWMHERREWRSDTQVHVRLVPEPAAACLMLLGLGMMYLVHLRSFRESSRTVGPPWVVPMGR